MVHIRVVTADSQIATRNDDNSGSFPIGEILQIYITYSVCLRYYIMKFRCCTYNYTV